MRFWYIFRRLAALVVASVVMLHLWPDSSSFVLHQTWKSSVLPEWSAAAVSSCRVHTTKFVLHSDEDNRALFATQFAELLRGYDALQEGVSKSDMARLLFMHVWGGVYLDLDVYCIQSPQLLLEELHRDGLQIGLGHLELAAHDHPDAIPNAVLMATRPAHPFWTIAMKICASNALEGDSSSMSVEQLCGPQALRQALQVYDPSCNLAADTKCKDIRIWPPHVLYPLSWAKQRIHPPACDNETLIQKCVQSLHPRPHTITFWRKSWGKKK